MGTILLLLSGDVHPNPGPIPQSNNCKSDLTLCHLNIRSLSQDKLRCIRTSLAPSYDIIAITETFLGRHQPDTDYNLPGFHSIIRRDRAGSVGGRVALFVSRALKVKRRADLEIPGIEILWVKIH